jgi:hypothetical protein
MLLPRIGWAGRQAARLRCNEHRINFDPTLNDLRDPEGGLSPAHNMPDGGGRSPARWERTAPRFASPLKG